MKLLLTLLIAFPVFVAAVPPAPDQARPSTAASASDWPQWRGPRRDGNVGAVLPAQWPATLSRKWELVVGAGHSSPVVADGKVVVMAREGEQEVVRALDLTSGKQLWRAEYPAPYTVNPAALAHGPGTKSTPAIASGRVFTLGIGGILSALDLATGKLIWRVPALPALPEYGTAVSPLVDASSVIVHIGGKDNGALSAFDAATGKSRWQWKGDGPAYGSPIIATIGGVRQLIEQTQKQIVGLNAADGRLLWQIPFTTEFNQSSITPVVFQDLVIYTGLDKPLAAIRPTRQGSTWKPVPVWSLEQAPMFMSSPVLLGNTLYGLTHRNRGQIVAVDPGTGKLLWSTQGREGDNASLFGNRSWLLVSTTNGEIIVSRQNPQKFDEVRRYRVTESAMWAHPAIAGRFIVVKDTNKVICWSY